MAHNLEYGAFDHLDDVLTPETYRHRLHIFLYIEEFERRRQMTRCCALKLQLIFMGGGGDCYLLARDYFGIGKSLLKTQPFQYMFNENQFCSFFFTKIFLIDYSIQQCVHALSLTLNWDSKVCNLGDVYCPLLVNYCSCLSL